MREGGAPFNMAAVSELIGSGRKRRNTSYSLLRSKIATTFGSSTYSRQGESQDSSIALESFIQNDTDTDGDHKDSDDEFVTISYRDHEVIEQEEFKLLLDKEIGVKRSCFHKGLVTVSIFGLLLVMGVILVEVFFPEAGVTRGVPYKGNNTNCNDELGLCITFRTVRSVGLMGLLIGLMNWVFIELLFRKVICVIGSGVIQSHYMTIRDGFRSIIMELLFNVQQLQLFFSERDDRIQRMLKLESRIGGLLNSNASQKIIDNKIEDILQSPEGFMLLHMGVDKESVRKKIQSFIKAFITDISPTIYRKLVVPGISDGEGLKSEISYILEPKLAQLKPKDVNKVVAVMLRKHLSWLIVWGSILGAVVGIVHEIILLITLLSIK